MRHIEFERSIPEQWSIITAPDFAENAENALREYGIPYRLQGLTKENFANVLDSYQLKKGDFVLDLSVCVGSKDIIAYC